MSSVNINFELDCIWLEQKESYSTVHHSGIRLFLVNEFNCAVLICISKKLSCPSSTDQLHLYPIEQESF